MSFHGRFSSLATSETNLNALVNSSPSLPSSSSASFSSSSSSSEASSVVLDLASTAAAAAEETEDQAEASLDLSSVGRKRLCEMVSDHRSSASRCRRDLRRARAQHEAQLASLCAQMMSLECGLRRKERELTAALKRRDGVIREQECVIRFLMGKVARGGVKHPSSSSSSSSSSKPVRSISHLEGQAMAKIPQLVESREEDTDFRSLSAAGSNVVRIRLGGGGGGGGGGAEETKQARRNSVISLGAAAAPIGGACDDSSSSGDSAILLSPPSSSSSSSSSSAADCSSSGASVSTSSSTSLSPRSNRTAANKEATNGEEGAERISSSTSIGFSSNMTRLRRISRSVSDVVALCQEQELEEEEGGSSNCDTLDSNCSARAVLGGILSCGGIAEEEEEKGSSSSSSSSSFSEFLPSSFGEEQNRELGAFFLRRGSFERYKGRDRFGVIKKGGFKKERERRKSWVGGGLEEELASSFAAPAAIAPAAPAAVARIPQGINHRSVTKPRDVKNRSRDRNRGANNNNVNVIKNNNSNNSIPPTVSSQEEEEKGSVYSNPFATEVEEEEEEQIAAGDS